MQHDGCEEIQLLISRLIDDEVSPGERARVEQHVAICDACACKMLEYMEMAVLFSETPLRQPDPDLRSSLFHEIGNLKDEAKLKEDAASRVEGETLVLPRACRKHRQAQRSIHFPRQTLSGCKPIGYGGYRSLRLPGSTACG